MHLRNGPRRTQEADAKQQPEENQLLEETFNSKRVSFKSIMHALNKKYVPVTKSLATILTWVELSAIHLSKANLRKQQDFVVR